MFETNVTETCGPAQFGQLVDESERAVPAVATVVTCGYASDVQFEVFA